MPKRDPLPTPSANTPSGPKASPGIRDRLQKKPKPKPVRDPDTESSEGRPLDPALLPIGDPAGAA